MRLDDVHLSALLRRQDGVVSRAQVLGCGSDDLLVARRLRRREWARVFEGVYVDHTGELSRRQRQWAAVLVHAPAALDAGSALEAWGVERHGSGRLVDVVVRAARRVDDPPGVRTTRLRDYDAVVREDVSPPRVRLEHAALTEASRAVSDDGAVAVLADVVRVGASSVERLRDGLAGRRTLRRRALLTEVLADVATGAQSPLERRYLRDVERAHRLPAGTRQLREATSGPVAYRDVAYRRHGVLVELDGQLGHDATRDRWSDLDRDLVAAIEGRTTLRAGWAQVLEPCRLAAVVGLVLARRAPTPLSPCGPRCTATVAAVG